ncbi:MAG: hypothetical protein ACRCX2_20300 [Paraclostridium sp.]
MRKEIKFELEATRRFVEDFAYTSNLTYQEKFEIAMYRSELVRMMSIPEELVKARPQRPPVFDRYE